MRKFSDWLKNQKTGAAQALRKALHKIRQSPHTPEKTSDAVDH